MSKRIVKRENGLQLFYSYEPFTFKNGGIIDELVLAFETFGELNVDKSNIIIIHHAFSADSHVSSSDENRNAGWWQEMVGPDKPIDTKNFFVICTNNLGSCFGSSGPTILDPKTKKMYQTNFPLYTFEDTVYAQKLLLDYLEIKSVHAIIGSSVGGMISLQFAVLFPNFAKNLICISSSYKAYPSNIANRAIQREIIQLDPDWKNGFYALNPTRGLKTARKLGFFTYRGVDEFDERFDSHRISEIPTDMMEEVSEIEKYLDYNAEKFVKNFDANTYLYQTKAMDLFDITNFQRDGHHAVADIKSTVFVISVESDKLFTANQQTDMYHLLIEEGVKTELIKHHSLFGHDTFLIEIDKIGAYISRIIK